MTTLTFKQVQKNHSFVSSDKLWVKVSQRGARHVHPGACRLSEFSSDQIVTIPCTVKIQYPLDGCATGVNWAAESISLATLDARVEGYIEEDAAAAERAKTDRADRMCPKCGCAKRLDSSGLTCNRVGCV